MSNGLYVDYMAGRSGWALCPVDEIEQHKSEVDFHTTWQLYCNEHMGQFGECYGNWPFDFDHEECIEIAQQDCIKAYDYLVGKGVNPKNIRLFFSGRKGFHMEIDYRSYMEKPIFDIHLVYRELYKVLDAKIKPEKHNSTMDPAIYSSRHLFRYPNTKHPKSSLYCIPLTYDELKLPYVRIFDLAENKRTIDTSYTDDTVMKQIFAEMQTRYWKSVEDFDKRKTLVKSYTGGYPPCIKKIMEEGLPAGNRNNTFYLLARFLKGIKKEPEVCSQLEELAAKSYSDSDGIREVKYTVASAFKREGSLLSCSSFSAWCDKEQCSRDSKKTSMIHTARVEKAFNLCSYKDAVPLLKDAIKRGEYSRVLKTGIDQLDMKTKILQDSVIVIASLSDVGKTSFAVTIARNNQDKRILYLAIEEGRDRTALRLLRSKVTEDRNITIVTGQIGSITPDDVYSFAYTHSSKFDFMIIDQLVNLTEESREERLKYKKMMEKFREISREFKKPIFVLHQLNRTAKFGKEQEPSKEQLAEGADIERLAYDVWLLYRRKIDDRTYNLLKIDKNKNYKSPIIIPVEYDLETSTFKDFPTEYIDWDVFKKDLGVIDSHEYFNGRVEEDIRV
jgi:hypothetical protein